MRLKFTVVDDPCDDANWTFSGKFSDEEVSRIRRAMERVARTFDCDLHAEIFVISTVWDYRDSPKSEEHEARLNVDENGCRGGNPYRGLTLGVYTSRSSSIPAATAALADLVEEVCTAWADGTLGRDQEDRQRSLRVEETPD